MKRFLCLAAVLVGLVAGPVGAGTNIGINVDGIADWMSAAAFIDASAMCRRWGMPGAGWQENPKLRLSADNLPLSDADAVSMLRGYPVGVYRLRYEGTGTVDFAGFGSIVPGSVMKADGVTTASVKVGVHKGEDLITIRVRGVDAADPVRNLQLLSPGYADAKRVFTDDFVRRVRPFSTIRFMDWQQTNGSPQKEWADRPGPRTFGRTGARGVPLEEIVALANATQRNVWVNVPLGASDDYVKQFATLLRDTLHAGAVIHVEYSNEVWNFGFVQAKENLFAARANAQLTKSDDFGRCAQQAADRLGRVARTFKEVFGEEKYAARVRPVIGGFIANTYWAQVQVDWLKEKHPGLVKELAIAPYFGVEGDIKDVDVAGATADALFDKLNGWIDGQIAKWVADHAALAKDFGVALVAYEGGVHLTATNNLNEEVKRRMQNDPRMGQTYRHMLDVWAKGGGGLFTQFGMIAPHTKFGYWSLLESAEQVGSVKWDTFMSLLLPAGDANLDGRVDFADFQIVKKNLGTGRWWEEGDFNGDGRVDELDLKILKAGLKGLTAEQQREVDGGR